MEGKDELLPFIREIYNIEVHGATFKPQVRIEKLWPQAHLILSHAPHRIIDDMTRTYNATWVAVFYQTERLKYFEKGWVL